MRMMMMIMMMMKMMMRRMRMMIRIRMMMTRRRMMMRMMTMTMMIRMMMTMRRRRMMQQWQRWWRSSRRKVIISFYIDNVRHYMDSLMQDSSISIANALEILQSCTKPSICLYFTWELISTTASHQYGKILQDTCVKKHYFSSKQFNKKCPGSFLPRMELPSNI